MKEGVSSGERESRRRMYVVFRDDLLVSSGGFYGGNLSTPQ
jgi:hypothetical protein